MGSNPIHANGVIVISCDDEPTENIIKNILNVDVLPAAYEKDGIKGYEWKIETKYYSAFVNLYAVHEQKEFESDICETIQATVLFFNGEKHVSFANILNWMPLLKKVNSEVHLLLCENCSSDVTHKKNILNWCIENQFELIELSSPEESDDEGENILSKSKGYRRVIEALQSHTWSNLVMKRNIAQQDDHIYSKNEVNVQTDRDPSCSSSKEVAENPKKVTVENEKVLIEDQWFQKIIEQDDSEGESFETLFAKFASMKEKAASLTGEERKKYAEKVAIAFCKAMGCDEEEIEGLEDYPS